MSTLLLSLAGLIVPTIVDALLKWAQGSIDVAQAKVDGANESTAAANKEAQDAQDRMSQVNAAPRSAELAAGRLRDGSF